MEIKDAQDEMRSAFLGGFAGQLVSGVIWLTAAAIGFFVEPLYGMAVLFFGSMFIFPLTQMLIRALGRPGKPVKITGFGHWAPRRLSPSPSIFSLLEQPRFIVSIGSSLLR